ncbi:hypothetical protein [Odoribacter laneus]|uniref:hypothetical protein n=1 Tax=Odoribacter laneus TaxID=626933 RepID=UPI003AF4124E
MKKLTILFFALFLFSCCPCKKKKEETAPIEKQETKINKVVETDSSRFKTISKEKESIIPDEDFEEMERYYEGEWGPV